MSDIYHIYDIKPEMNLIIICSIADVEKFIRYLWILNVITTYLLRHNGFIFTFYYICIYHNNLSAFKCKTCKMNFEDKRHLENHKKAHGRKPKVYEYGDPEFTKNRLRG